jgi:hypothetical protein
MFGLVWLVVTCGLDVFVCKFVCWIDMISEKASFYDFVLYLRFVLFVFFVF